MGCDKPGVFLFLGILNKSLKVDVRVNYSSDKTEESGMDWVCSMCGGRGEVHTWVWWGEI